MRVFSAANLAILLSLPLHNPSFWALATCAIAALCEGIMSGSGVKSRFAEVRLPKGAPRLWSWAVIGGAYYVLFFFLLRSILAEPSTPFWTSVTLTLTAVLLIANASWNWIFFRGKNLWLSLVFFVPYFLLALTLAGVLHHVRNPLSTWYAFYLAYLAYASWWAYRVWQLNCGSSKMP
ncbi:MAG TPA: tryptophan-rich sensory protein [Candidatus Sulfotelmatobacter sp.]|nr:tryptophan-rich sensory protein [Candidatus Sulfotelmatobacter sp.]